MRISDWSSDVCSSDLEELRAQHEQWRRAAHADTRWAHFVNIALGCWILVQPVIVEVQEPALFWSEIVLGAALILFATLSLSWRMAWARWRSEEHTSELQSLMRISYAVFCLKKKKTQNNNRLQLITSNQ